MIKIEFAPWTAKASLEVEMPGDTDPRFTLRAALEIAAGKVKRGELPYDALDGARLDGASLDGRTLRSFKADLWMILTQNKAEVPGLIDAIKEGRINGSTYTGKCACLMGTIANVRHVSVDELEQDASRPAEQWFMMIKVGDKPGDKSGGGFAVQMALEWALEWCALNSASQP